MAWNGSGDTGRARTPSAPQKKSGASSPLWLKGALAGLVVVAIGAAVLYMTSPKADNSESKASKVVKVAKIVESTPSKVINHVKETNVADGDRQFSELRRDERIKIYQDRYGTNMPPNIRAVVYHLKNPPKETYHQPKSRAHIFKARSDRKIASALLMTPGKFVLRQPKFDEKFDQDFLANMFVNEEIAPEDSAADKELKTAVAETKRELAGRVRETGLKPSEIMNSETATLCELAKYRRNLETELRKIKRDSSVSDADVQDYVNAANKMLEAKGLSGFKMPNLLARQAMLSTKENQAEN